MNKRSEKECECSVEYVLPDYLGEIKRVLSAQSRCVSQNKFVGEDGIECSGSVGFFLTYLDVDGEVGEIDTLCDFECVFTMDMSGYKDSCVESEVSSFNYRVLGPRKLNLKAKVLSCAECEFEGGEEKCEVDGAEYDTETVEIFGSIFGAKQENEYSEEFYSDEDASAQIEIISSFGSVKISESKPETNGVVISGDYIIGAIIRRDGDIFSVKKNIPFEERIELEGVYESTPTLAWGNLTNIDLKIAEEDKSKINLNLSCDLFAKAGINDSVEIVKDAYYKNYDSLIEYAPFETKSLLNMWHENVTVPLEFSIEELGFLELREVLKPCATLQGYELIFEDEMAKIAGNLAVSGVACEINEDNEVVYSPVKLNGEFEFPMEKCQVLSENYEYNLKMQVFDTDFVINGDKLSFNVLLDVRLEVFKPQKNMKIKSIQKNGDEKKRDSSVYTVYFPKNDDTLFSVAKRFSTSKEKIAKDNLISSETMTDSNFVLPKRLIIT